MVDVVALLTERLQRAFDAVEPGADPVLRPSERADFQSNGALALAKALGANPSEIAAKVVALAELDDVCADVTVSGPGFINLTLSDGFLAHLLDEMSGDERLGVANDPDRQTIVVDYSAPNVAKEMHVGHLRTTVIGDALCRFLEFVGHDVRRENHIGDWGTPFGMLIEHLVDLGEAEAVQELSVGDLAAFYRDARRSFDAEPSFQARSRTRVVLLQRGDQETLRLWRILVAASVSYFDEVYGKLGVLLSDDDIVGESFYNPMLNDVVADLQALGLLVEDEGARCVFPPGFTNRAGEPLPLIIQKSDGGFGYAATDLAAIRDRVGRIGVRRIYYVVGAPQSQHLEMVFAVARMAGWLDDSVHVEHVAFGNVLGTDHKMLKSRAGESVKLLELLDEAIERAGAAVAARDSDLDEAARREVAITLGIGAVKYADLSTERTRDYVFDWDRMLAFEGNTGPYLQYAHARICSIFRRANLTVPDKVGFSIESPHERALAVALVGFEEAIGQAIATSNPSRLCAYLYHLATTFTGFYENCPILRAEDDVREARLCLSDLTARVLRTGLSLLGIAAPAQM